MELATIIGYITMPLGNAPHTMVTHRVSSSSLKVAHFMCLLLVCQTCVTAQALAWNLWKHNASHHLHLSSGNELPLQPLRTQLLSVKTN